MNDTATALLLGMSPLGWLIGFAAGFVIGGIYFLTMKLQVEYVLKKQGPIWLIPVVMYARLAFVGAIVATVGLTLGQSAPDKIPAAVISATMAAMLARVLIGRMVKEDRPTTTPEDSK